MTQTWAVQYFPCHPPNIHRHFCFANRQKPSKAKKIPLMKNVNSPTGLFFSQKPKAKSLKQMQFIIHNLPLYGAKSLKPKA
jgi:hypothetical protein